MNSQKFLIALAIILAIGLIAEGAYLVSIKKRIDNFESGQISTASNIVSNNPFNLNPYKKGFSNKFKRDWYWDSFLGDGWEPFEEMKRIQQQFNRIFNESFGRGMRSRGFIPSLGDSFFEPDIDIKGDKTHYIVKMDIPGLEKDKINIEVKDKMLMVSGEREAVFEENKGDRYFRQERSYGHFLRAIPLPDDIREDEISADYKNGVLTVKIAKLTSAKEKEKKSRKIQVF